MNRKIFGSIIILLGVLLLLNSTGVIELSIWSLIGTYWPVLLIGAGLYNIITNPVSKTAGVIVLIIGISFQMMTLGYFNIFEYNILWPVVIIIIGISFIYSDKQKWDEKTKSSINSVALFSSYNVKNVNSNFKGGSATAMFGGIDLNLKQSQIADNQEAVLDIFIAFGGMDIFVPEDWNVVIKGIPIFGGWDNKTKNVDSENPTIIIHSMVLFGGYDVKN